MNFDYKNILIMGYSKSGLAVEEILKILKVNYKIYDKNHKINGGHFYSKLNKKIISQFDLIVISPGVSIYNKFIILAEKLGIKVVGELEFGYWFTSSPVIAITGTNGKTTTTSLINDIVASTYKSGAFGNIGVPLSCAYNRDYDYLICEVSSFQLESTYSFKPYISIILNIAPDHIDRHKNFENYIKCKIGLLKNCNEKSIMILNYDDELIMERTSKIKAKKYYISKYKKVKGVYLYKDKIYASLNSKSNIEIMSISDIDCTNIIIENVLASILVGLLLKIDKNTIVDAVKKFKIMPHKLQLIYEKNNVKFIDDSKSTNVHSTINAIKYCKENIVLLLGGCEKKINFDEIFLKYKSNLKYIIAFGETRKKIFFTAKKYQIDNVKIAHSFRDAVNFACELSKENDTVLLSPACSSFDEFSSYAERGEKFGTLVKELLNAKS